MSGYEEYIERVKEAIKVVEEKDRRRELLIRKGRDIMSSIRKAINYIHMNRLEEAESLLNKIKESLFSLMDEVAKIPSLLYSGTMNNLIQEYVEATTYFMIVKEGVIPSYEEYRLTDIAQYFTGLADVIGELRRRVLEYIRKGKLKDAEHTFHVMESLYSALLEVVHYDPVVPGIRHKCDVARVLVENTRSEVVRAKLSFNVMTSINRLLEILEKSVQHEDSR
ncbi:MAG: hypothetical protein DRZ82_00535 [Thermoprotei archaeon]|nr:MAG: hypothetical protein DRZ82_00535 [Thermoprotei archaeon]